jgi:hypothetical protein
LAGNAFQPDLAAQQLRDFTANGQPQPRSAVLAAGGPIRLLERFEYDPLLLQRDPDAGILH